MQDQDATQLILETARLQLRASQKQKESECVQGLCAKAIGSKYAPDFWGTILIVYKLLTWDDACTVLCFRLAMLCVTLLPLAVMIITSHLSFLDDGYMSYSIIEFGLVPKKSGYLCHSSFADPAPISMQYQSGSKVNFPLCYGVRNLTVFFVCDTHSPHPNTRLIYEIIT